MHDHQYRKVTPKGPGVVNQKYRNIKRRFFRMAALLVVAIVRAMSPPRALPCGKIHPFHPFYLSRYF
jgi:hypothetical protein